MNMPEQVLRSLQARGDIYPDIHMHFSRADVRDGVMTQDVYLCAARAKTTYNIHTMREWLHTFDVSSIQSEFSTSKSCLRFGELVTRDVRTASIYDLDTDSVRALCNKQYDLHKQRQLTQTVHVLLLPCKRLLNRHPGTEQMNQCPAWSGNKTVDQFIVRMLVVRWRRIADQWNKVASSV